MLVALEAKDQGEMVYSKSTCLSIAKLPKVINKTTIVYRVPTRGFPGGNSGKESPARAGGAQFLRCKEPLEKEVATSSSIFAYEIPRTEEPGGLQSTGSQRVGAQCECLLCPTHFLSFHSPVAPEGGTTVPIL